MKKTVLAMIAALFVSSGVYAQETKSDKHDPHSQIEKRTEKMKEVLALNDAQYAKVKELNTSMMNERMKIHEKAEADKRDRHASMKQLRESHDQQLRKILSEDQWKKWESYRQAQIEKRKNGGKGKYHRRGDGRPSEG